MPFVNPTTTGRGMNFTAVPEPGDAEDDEENARHHRAHEQAVDAVLRDDPRDHDDESAGGPADLAARAAERRDQESGDDRAVDPRLRRQAGGDREGHGERERDEADGDAREQIRHEGRAVVRAKGQDGLRQPCAVITPRSTSSCWVSPMTTALPASVTKTSTSVRTAIDPAR